MGVVILKYVHKGSFLKDFIYLFIFRERGREKIEKERNIHWLSLKGPQPGTWAATGPCALTENRTMAFPFGDDAQPTEPQQSGLSASFDTPPFQK